MEEDEVLGVLAPIRVPRPLRRLVVTRRGLLVTRLSVGQLLGYSLRTYAGGTGAGLALRTAQAPLPRLYSDARRTDISRARIARLHVVGRTLRASRMELTFTDGSRSTFKFDSQGGSAGEVWPAMAHYLGERFTVAE